MSLEPTDRRCSCGDRIFATLVATDEGPAELAGCPFCDRPRCASCGQHFGFLFARYVRKYSLADDGSRCEPCLTGVPAGG